MNTFDRPPSHILVLRLVCVTLETRLQSELSYPGCDTNSAVQLKKENLA